MGQKGMETKMSERKTAIVTGGSRGIGRAVCVRLAKDGFDIVLNYQTSDAQAKETAAECEALGVRVLIVKANIAKSEDCDRLVQEAAAFGGGKVAVLVNNAGITRDNLLARMTDEELDAVIDVNLKGSFYMMRAVSRLMLKARYGRIINMSSIAGVMGNAGQMNYAASKAAVIGMTKSLARELASRKITVNAIAPGMIETAMTDAIPEAAKAKLLEGIPFREMGQPEDVANLVAFLAGDESKYITGQVICVDGGMAI